MTTTTQMHTVTLRGLGGGWADAVASVANMGGSIAQAVGGAKAAKQERRAAQYTAQASIYTAQANLQQARLEYTLRQQELKQKQNLQLGMLAIAGVFVLAMVSRPPARKAAA